MRLIKVISASVAVAAASAGIAAGAGAAAPNAAARQYEGTVVKVDRPAKTFRLRDSERGTVTIKVNNRTRFERVNGLAGLRAGMRNIEATVKRSGGAWLATEVERSGGGGQHGGNNSGNDDNGGDRGRGSDDSGGDDNGGHGRGSDDTGPDDNGGDRGSDD